MAVRVRSKAVWNTDIIAVPVMHARHFCMSEQPPSAQKMMECIKNNVKHNFAAPLAAMAHKWYLARDEEQHVAETCASSPTVSQPDTYKLDSWWPH
jgi:hypothetical protein